MSKVISKEEVKVLRKTLIQEFEYIRALNMKSKIGCLWDPKVR